MDPLQEYKKAVAEVCNNHDKDAILKILDALHAGKMSRYKLFKTFNSDEVEAFNIEVLQNVMLIQDDIMDNSTTRRGKPCYHLVADTPLRDSYFLYALLMKITKNPFLVSELVIKTCLGQFLDLSGGLYTKENYKKICEYKTGYYTIMLPILLSGAKSDNLEHFTRLYGLYYQMLDDALNFTDKEKSSTDLEDFKVTWFSVWLKEEFYHEQIVKDYFEKKILCPELIKKCYELSKSDRFKSDLNSVLNEIKVLIKNDNVLQQAFNTIYDSRLISLENLK